MNKAGKQLKAYRERLLRLDKKLIGILAERAIISEEIGCIKFHEKLGIEQKQFWKESTEKRKQTLAKTPLDEKWVEKIFSSIQKQSISIQKAIIKKLNHE